MRKNLRPLAFLTMDGLEEHHVADDHLLLEPLRAAGWEVTWIPWRQKSIPWNDFEAVIIRSTWDYQSSPAAFLQTLEEAHQAGVSLANDYETVRWNLDKIYLQDLHDQGLPVVPTRFLDSLNGEAFEAACQAFGVEELVVKPRISATSNFTYRLRRDNLEEVMEELEGAKDRGGLMLQPFIPSIQTQGEISLFYFAGTLSHAISKTPKAGDFRSQEEYGGALLKVTPNSDQLQVGDALMGPRQHLLYGRVDLVQDPAGQWRIMELELIEPSLYFRLDPDSPARFVEAFVSWRGERSINIIGLDPG